MAKQESGDAKQREVGLFGSLKALLATLIDIAHTRLQLLGAELEVEFARVRSMLIWGYVALLFASLAVWFLCLTILIAFWDTPYRLLVAGGLTVFFILLAAVAVGFIVRLVHSRKRLFDASLSELERDQEDLGSDR